MATILVTGATGFVGSHAAAGLAAAHTVVGIGRAALAVGTPGWRYVRLDPAGPDLPGFLRELSPDHVIHCAGSGLVGPSFDDPVRDFQAGPGLTFALLDALRQAAPGASVIFVSSAAVYGAPDAPVIDASFPLRPISPYGFHKVICETVFKEFSEVYGLDAVILRVFSLYGAGLRKQVVWDICRKSQGGLVNLFGTGQETRDFLHIQDFVRLLHLLVEKKKRRGLYNVGSGRAVTIDELARRVTVDLGRPDVPIAFDGREHKGYPRRWLADVTDLDALGFAPEITLEAGIEEYCRWFSSPAAAQ